VKARSFVYLFTIASPVPGMVPGTEYVLSKCERKGKEGGRKEGREGGRQGGREGGREAKGGLKEREAEKEEVWKRREGRKKGGREEGRIGKSHVSVTKSLTLLNIYLISLLNKDKTGF